MTSDVCYKHFEWIHYKAFRTAGLKCLHGGCVSPWEVTCFVFSCQLQPVLGSYTHSSYHIHTLNHNTQSPFKYCHLLCLPPTWTLQSWAPRQQMLTARLRLSIQYCSNLSNYNIKEQNNVLLENYLKSSKCICILINMHNIQTSIKQTWTYMDLGQSFNNKV